MANSPVPQARSKIDAGLLDNRQVELLKGEIVEMPPEGEAHAFFSSEAEDYLRSLLSDRAMIRSGKPIIDDHTAKIRASSMITIYQVYRIRRGVCI